MSYSRSGKLNCMYIFGDGNGVAFLTPGDADYNHGCESRGYLYLKYNDKIAIHNAKAMMQACHDVLVHSGVKVMMKNGVRDNIEFSPDHDLDRKILEEDRKKKFLFGDTTGTRGHGHAPMYDGRPAGSLMTREIRL